MKAKTENILHINVHPTDFLTKLIYTNAVSSRFDFGKNLGKNHFSIGFFNECWVIVRYNEYIYIADFFFFFFF